MKLKTIIDPANVTKATIMAKPTDVAAKSTKTLQVAFNQNIQQIILRTMNKFNPIRFARDAILKLTHLKTALKTPMCSLIQTITKNY
jgi:hypothetical protein